MAYPTEISVRVFLFSYQIKFLFLPAMLPYQGMPSSHSVSTATGTGAERKNYPSSTMSQLRMTVFSAATTMSLPASNTARHSPTTRSSFVDVRFLSAAAESFSVCSSPNSDLANFFTQLLVHSTAGQNPQGWFWICNIFHRKKHCFGR